MAHEQSPVAASENDYRQMRQLGSDPAKRAPSAEMAANPHLARDIMPSRDRGHSGPPRRAISDMHGHPRRTRTSGIIGR